MNIHTTVAIRSFLLMAILMSPASIRAANTTLVDWQPWQPQAFVAAKQEKKLILLNMEAVWCHWCHVMDAKTYSNPKVANYLQQHYITLRVDQDARPDLANRYRDYGWPATIVLNADGTDLVKRAGYIAPDDMLRLLKAIVADPSPEAAAAIPVSKPAKQALLAATVRKAWQNKRLQTYDHDKGGLNTAQKFIDRNSLEYNLVLAAEGNLTAQKMANQTLQAATALLDPVWGGIYQYSTGYDWHTPHYEKLISSQTSYLRLYALAGKQLQAPEHTAVAEAIAAYIQRFLSSPEGAAYVSQDADLIPGQHSADYFRLDDSGRRALGVPRVDKHRYARESGWLIEALATLYRFNNNPVLLQQAQNAAAWVHQHRTLPGQAALGGFRHAEQDRFGPFLGDTLAMGRAHLALYHATGQRQWLTQAIRNGDFIANSFVADSGLASSNNSQLGPGLADLEENISAARFLNLLSHYSGQDNHRQTAKHCMRWLASPDLPAQRFEESGILLADQELSSDPPHLTVVGSMQDPAAQVLFKLARSQAGWYQRIEWLDRQNGPLPNADVPYPQFEQAAAYVCAQGRCSLPAFTPQDYQRRIDAYSVP